MKRASILLGLLLVAGCSTTQVATEFQRDANFARLRRFDFASGNLIQPADPNVNIAEARQLTRQIIATALTAKGYQWQTNAAPDFLVGYRIVGTDKREESATDPFTMGGGPAWEDLPRTPHVRRYREGTLVLSVGDPASHRILWRATATTELQRSITATEREQKIREAVNQLLAGFPPR